jgi:SdrD B-like domain/Domain of unknown function (DUF4214)
MHLPFRQAACSQFRAAIATHNNRRHRRLLLEKLEDRTVPSTTTFAQFQPLFPALQAFEYTDNGNGTVSFHTISGGDPVLVTFDSSLVSGLSGTQVDAHLFLSATTDQTVTGSNVAGSVVAQRFPATTNSLMITLDTPVGGKTNFLTVTFSGQLEGQAGLPEASFQASDSAQPPNFVSFSSDFIDFSNSVNHGFSLAFSSLLANDGTVGLQISADGFFKPFAASGTGTFDTNFVLPAVIQGLKFEDLNANGIRDANEPGMAGVTIQLLDPTTNQVLFTTTTDGTGAFSFTVPAGTYEIREVEPNGFIQTTPNPADITVTPGQDLTGILFGNAPTASIGGGGGSTTPPPVISKTELLSSNYTAIAQGELQAEEGFVNGLYHTLLDRAPDPGGLANFVLLMQAGLSRQQIVQMIWDSPEHRALEVNRLYEEFLGRPADPAGQSFFVNALLSGATELDVMQAILTSAEYQASHASNVSFLTGLYVQVLGRSPDMVGETAWLQLLQNDLTRGQVVADFLTSTEATEHFLGVNYLTLLGRPPDSAGEQYWLSLIADGQTSLDTVAVAIAGSDEFFARFGGP